VRSLKCAHFGTLPVAAPAEDDDQQRFETNIEFMRSVVFFLIGALWFPPLHAGGPADCQDSPEQVLEALNDWRDSSRACGGEAWGAARPLRWNPQLALSARMYAEELAARDTVSHEGLVLPTLSRRLRAAGYRMLAGGENLAAGQERLGDVLEQWMASRSHCENLMQPRFQDAGLACVTGPGHYGYYWVLHLGVAQTAVRSNPDQSP
jgi:uncharacterized protein YkwD